MSIELDLTALIRQGESELVEFKSRPPLPDVVARILAAFANTSGGTLLVGVADDGTVTGLSAAEVVRALGTIRSVAASLLPSPVEAGRAESEGKAVVYARVPKAPNHLSPVSTARGGVPRRQGSRISVDTPDDLYKQSHTSRAPPRDALPGLKVFVAMSFREELEPALEDYYRAIERAAAAAQVPLEVNRIDRVDGDYEISQGIMDAIDTADIVLTDFTLTPPNVYFELGYARGCRKRVIQTARKGTVLEFDVRNWRTLFYRNATDLEQKLIPQFKAAYLEVRESVG